jgi:hypothetical protein
MRKHLLPILGKMKLVEARSQKIGRLSRGFTLTTERPHLFHPKWSQGIVCAECESEKSSERIA